jgi:glutathione-specific gamma-glutamylcyclotransferase
MRLTHDLVVEAARRGDDPGAVLAADADYAAMSRRLLAARPANGEVWVFAYGSLIWKPACDIAEQRIALARGWHRAFCLGWDRCFRGTKERPGLMLALDRGGTCKGVVQRLPPDAVEANLEKLLRREVLTKPSPFPPRWISVQTASGPLSAITFTMSRTSEAYVGGLSAEEIADVLAVAAGRWGSMAEYLYNTVSQLEELGIGDRFLWRLQELVADRIEASTAGRYFVP